MTQLSIVIVDADEIWRRGFRRLVEEEGGWKVCAEAPDGASASRLLLEEKPDVVAIDGNLPTHTIESLHRLRPEAAILVFAAPSGHNTVDEILSAGAKGLVSKSDPFETVLAAIEAVARHDLFFSPNASELVLERYLGGRQRSEVRRAPSLTRRERDVVSLLAQGGRNRELARTLRISVKTVENHRANAMRKLGVRTVSDLVREAIRLGMIDS